MTVGELSERMTSEELTEWMAIDMFLDPIPNEWQQTGVIASAVLAPHCGKNRGPKASDFIPRQHLPQSQEDMARELAKLKHLSKGS